MATYTSPAARANMLATINACDSKGVVKNFNPADSYAAFAAKLLASEALDTNEDITVSQVGSDTRIVVDGAAASAVLAGATGSDDLSNVVWDSQGETIHLVTDIQNREIPGQPGDEIPIPAVTVWIRALNSVA